MAFKAVPQLAAVLLAALTIQAAHAQKAHATFRIAAGPATVSIPEFARQANLKVLANGDALAGIVTPALEGSYAPEAGLAKLLAGTHLATRTSPNGTVLIVPAAARTEEEDVAKVLVVGTRASEQSANERKKNAATAADSVIADDLGSLPDNNVAEAVSRIAGVALDRGEYGEGFAVNVRGVGPGETRVEIDGMAVMSAGGYDLNGGGDGRGVEMRELPADLIASVDVVKGYTADMTEGSLGGSVIIKTRTGLDFKKRTVSLRASASQNSINEKWTPSANLIYAGQFLGRRVGLVLNLSRADNGHESHQQQINDNSSGYSRLMDLDDSPHKSFQFNPLSVSNTDPAAGAPMASWAKSPAFPAGARFNSMSPIDIVTRSAGARTKQDCHAAFPAWSTDELATIGRAQDRISAQNVRTNELRTCLNQWNDYTPSTIRYVMKRQNDERLNADLRVDFKVSDKLRLYAKYNRSKRGIEEQVMHLSLGRIVIEGTPEARTTNIVPGTLKVDANHHVTEAQISNGATNNDALATRMESSTRTASAGGSWRSGGLRADFLLGRTEGQFWRYNLRSNVGFSYGPVTMAVMPNGLWTYLLPRDANLDQTVIGRYGVLTAQPNGQLHGPRTQLTLDNPRAGEQSEDTVKADTAYSPGGRLPLLDSIKFGIGRRAYGAASWSGGGGYTVKPGVVVPRAAVGSALIACETGTSAAPCPYGATGSSTPLGRHNSTIVMTQAQYRDIVAQGLAAGQSTRFYNSASDRPVNLFDSWTPLDAATVIALTGVRHMNMDCVKSCMADDGQVYEQPRSAVSERISSAYLSADFSLDDALPFGMELDGNVGWRYVRAEVAGTGLLTFRSILKTPAYDPLNPDAPSGIGTTTLARNTTLRRRSTDLLPVLNLALWAVPNQLVLRYARASMIARPPVSRLVSSGVSCTYDERLAPGVDNDETLSCDGVMGNPGLRPKRNLNTSLSLEWYADGDSMLSLAAFRQKGMVGAAQRARLDGQRPFSGSGLLDPASGRALGELEYAYQSWTEGPAATRSGLEVSGKTAFTFLPGYLRHTGVNANITKVRSRNNEVAVVDPISGDFMAPVGEQKYSWNTALWYDDGKLSMRLALQVATPSYARMATGTYAPASGDAGNTVALSFNPGSAMFRDERRWIDARIGYKIGAHLELFAEARNLGRAAQTESQGRYVPFAGGVPSIFRHQYGGARYSAGLVIRQR